MVDESGYSKRAVEWWARIRVGLLYVLSLYFLVGAYIFTELDPTDGRLAMAYSVLFLILLGLATKEWTKLGRDTNEK